MSLASFPVPVCLERETQYTPAYHNSSKIFNGLFVYTEKGRGCFKEHKRQWDLVPGTAYACSGLEPGVSYFYPPEGKEPWTFWWLRFKGEYAESMLKDLINHYGHIYHIPLNHPVIRRLSERLESDDKDQFITLQEGSSMVLGVINMLAEVYSRKYYNRPQPQMILKAKKLILEHLDKNISCQELAAGLGISREHLSRQFKQETGMSPVEFIIRCKMNEACGMLKESAMSCKEIAFKSGYDNASNFIRAFSKYQKMTPMEFRKKGALPRF
ncbi:MAG: AraC family transcriptional regulator [Victivallaceae bacterium]|nr:AraC family transcriptional regulator [Victivallaceae bacterium]